MILVSRNIRHMRIFAGVSWGRVSKDSGVVEDGNVIVFTGYMFGNFRQDRQDIHVYIGFSVVPKCTTSNEPEYL